jgi:hypothetical protein
LFFNAVRRTRMGSQIASAASSPAMSAYSATDLTSVPAQSVIRIPGRPICAGDRAGKELMMGRSSKDARHTTPCPGIRVTFARNHREQVQIRTRREPTPNSEHCSNSASLRTASHQRQPTKRRRQDRCGRRL